MARIYKQMVGKGLATEERRKVAREMYAAGDSIRRIAQHFHVSPERAYEVVSPVRRMGKGNTQHPEGTGLSTETRRRIARKMFKAGENLRRIAWHFQVSYERAYEVVNI